MSQAVSPVAFRFPAWANWLAPVLGLVVLGAVTYMPALLYFGNSPYTTSVGYQPTQPVPFSHALHAGKLGMDCRYCHSTVEKAAFAAVPPTQTCMNCHHVLRTDSSRLAKVIESWNTGDPIKWVKIHDLPDYAYFDHSAHVNKGVGCVTCHGRVDQMEVVYQAQPLSMAWCLDCHREPEKYLRPLDKITVMNYQPQRDQLVEGLELKKQYGIRGEAYMTSCFTCHR